jgi:uncharacterized membrane protein
MNNDILFLGDTALKEAACYLAGVMTANNISFDYLPSDAPISDDHLKANYAAIIISDYPANNFTPTQFDHLATNVQNGQGLLMVGGWESFAGQKIEYTHTILKNILPVIMQNSDDRINCSGPCLIEKLQDHAILANLPFDDYSPGIGGFNQFKAKPDANILLNAQQFAVNRHNDNFTFTKTAASPLLVTGSFGKGKVAAFATDFAPHWVGGFVDWGNTRITAKAEGSVEIEVDNWYAEFAANLIRWVGGK